MVYLVGAGPGDPELLTLKALRLIQSADIIYYDLLVSPEIMAFARPDALKIFVGKEDGHHFVEQNEINELLIKSAKEGKVVVRLKGGDPFVFGRGGEEALDMVQAGIDFEVVPGISSSVAAPAYAGIPVTHRNVATSYAVITGHLCSNSTDGIDYGKFVHVDTLVFLMGIKRRDCIARSLLIAGRNPNDPVAFIEKGTTSQQKVSFYNLDQVAKGETEAKSPAVMIIGPVVELGKQINWFDPSKQKKTNANLAEVDRQIINQLQKNFPLVEKPFQETAQTLGIPEEAVFKSLKSLSERKIVSRLGPVITPNTIGKSELIALSVPAEKLEQVAAFVSSYLEVNHNYERENKYNLWFVITAIDEQRINVVVSEIENEFGLKALRLPLLEDYHIDLGFSI